MRLEKKPVGFGSPERVQGMPPPGERPPGARPQATAKSIEPSSTTYLLRRVSVVLAMVLLVAIGAVGTGLVSLPGSTATDGQPPTTEPAASALPVAAAPTAIPLVPPATVDPASAGDGLPARTSRLVPQAPQRVLDTRNGDGQPSADNTYSIQLEEGRTAVALSVSVMGTTGPGSVYIDGGAGVVEAVTVDKAGVTTTNLVIVPVVSDWLTVRTSGGGHLTVDVVGGFVASGEATAGRFIAGQPTEITRLVTETDGREADLPFGEAVPVDQASSLLVLINADVGADGGMVQLGPSGGDYDQMLMWGPATEGTKQRRGLALVTPDAAGIASLRYDGGSVLTAQVVGYFTNDGQPASIEGLYVPTGPRQLFDGVLQANNPVVVDGLAPQARTAFVTVASSSIGPGQLGSFLVPTADGQAALSTSGELQSVVTLLGVFL